MAASTPIFTPATDTFGDLRLRTASQAMSQRVRHAVIGAGFVATLVLAGAGLFALDRAAYAQHDSDPYAGGYMAAATYEAY